MPQLQYDWQPTGRKFPVPRSAYRAMSRPDRPCFFLMSYRDQWNAGGSIFHNDVDRAFLYAADELKTQAALLEAGGFCVQELQIFIPIDHNADPVYLGTGVDIVLALSKPLYRAQFITNEPHVVSLDLSEVWLRANSAHGMHWAVPQRSNDDCVVVHFIDSKHRIIDKLIFERLAKCREALRTNGFVPQYPDELLHQLYPLPDMEFEKLNQFHLKVFSRYLAWKQQCQSESSYDRGLED